MSTFSDFNLPQSIMQALGKMNFAEPTPIQSASIPVALSGRDILASAQTGTGKTAAFGIPMLVKLLAEKDSQALVLAPTRELAAQILASLRDLAACGPRMADVLVIGGTSIGRQRHQLSTAPRIIVATPGRLVDLLNSRSILLSKVRYLVLDEADRMLDMGFAPMLRVIRRSLPAERQTFFFSATYPTDIMELAAEWLRNPERIAIGSVTKPAELVQQERVNVASDGKNEAMLSELEKREGSVLVFARTKRRTDRLSRFLDQSGISVTRIHGDRSQAQREQALNGFREGKYRVLVATDIAARGIDVPHIEHVINYDLPYVPEDYLHRIGRTARAGRSGTALCLVAPEERVLWKAIEKLLQSKNGLHSSDRQKFSPKDLLNSGKQAPSRHETRRSDRDSNQERQPEHNSDRRRPSQSGRSSGRSGSQASAGSRSPWRGERSSFRGRPSASRPGRRSQPSV